MKDSVLSNMFLKPFRLVSIMMLFRLLVLDSSSDQTEFDLSLSPLPPTDILRPPRPWLRLDRLSETAELFRLQSWAASYVLTWGETAVTTLSSSHPPTHLGLLVDDHTARLPRSPGHPVTLITADTAVITEVEMRQLCDVENISNLKCLPCGSTCTGLS